ncbi:MAG TPA: hypothetical protein VKU02_18650 [Gemmataceae bacterium]|nr:hypothetical protein [Gemmataceae bacterium]
MLVPDEAGEGKAELTFSFDAWKTGHVARTTIQLPVVQPTEEQANVD